MLKSLSRNQKKCFFAHVLWFLFFLKIFSTILTLLCLDCLFHMNNNIDLVVNVMFVESVSGWNVTLENISKKKHKFFLIPDWRSQHFRHLFKNPKLKLMASFSSNHSLDLYLLKSLGPWIKYHQLGIGNTQLGILYPVG